MSRARAICKDKLERVKGKGGRKRILPVRALPLWRTKCRRKKQLRSSHAPQCIKLQTAARTTRPPLIRRYLQTSRPRVREAPFQSSHMHGAAFEDGSCGAAPLFCTLYNTTRFVLFRGRRIVYPAEQSPSGKKTAAGSRSNCGQTANFQAFVKAAQRPSAEGHSCGARSASAPVSLSVPKEFCLNAS